MSQRRAVTLKTAGVYLAGYRASALARKARILDELVAFGIDAGKRRYP